MHCIGTSPPLQFYPNLSELRFAKRDRYFFCIAKLILYSRVLYISGVETQRALEVDVPVSPTVSLHIVTIPGHPTSIILLVLPVYPD